MFEPPVQTSVFELRVQILVFKHRFKHRCWNLDFEHQCLDLELGVRTLCNLEFEREFNSELEEFEVELNSGFNSEFELEVCSNSRLLASQLRVHDARSSAFYVGRGATSGHLMSANHSTRAVRNLQERFLRSKPLGDGPPRPLSQAERCQVLRSEEDSNWSFTAASPGSTMAPGEELGCARKTGSTASQG